MHEHYTNITIIQETISLIGPLIDRKLTWNFNNVQIKRGKPINYYLLHIVYIVPIDRTLKNIWLIADIFLYSRSFCYYNPLFMFWSTWHRSGILFEYIMKAINYVSLASKTLFLPQISWGTLVKKTANCVIKLENYDGIYMHFLANHFRWYHQLTFEG